MNTDRHIPPGWLEPTLHSAYFTLFSEFVRTARAMPVLAPVGNARLIPFIDFVPLLDAVNADTEPATGILLGLNIPAISHGPMGFVAQSSADLRQVLAMLATCNPVRNRMQQFSFKETEDQIIHRIDKVLDLDTYQAFVNLAVLFGIFNVLVAIFNEEVIGAAELHVPMPKLAFALDDYFSKAPRVYWNSKELAIVFPRKLADTPNPYADNNMLHHNLLAVNAELARLDGNIASKIKFILNQSHPHWYSIDQVAAALSMSGRTLTRKLKKEDVNFQNLLDEAKSELACWYLSKSTLPIVDISQRVGFSDPGNFTRLFKRLHKMTPHEYRRLSRIDSPSLS